MFMLIGSKNAAHNFTSWVTSPVLCPARAAVNCSHGNEVEQKLRVGPSGRGTCFHVHGWREELQAVLGNLRLRPRGVASHTLCKQNNTTSAWLTDGLPLAAAAAAGF